MSQTAKNISVSRDEEGSIDPNTLPVTNSEISVPKHELIAREAANLEDFLARHELMDRYFTAMNDYLGGNETHFAAFKIIISQLKQIRHHVPGLSERLWDTENLGIPLLVPLGIKAYGRNVNAERWTVFLSTWRQHLINDADVFLSMASLERRENEFESHVRDLGREFARIHKMAEESPDKKTGVFLRTNFYRSIKTDRRLVAAASYALLSAIDDKYFIDRLRGDADLILNTMNQLQFSTEAVIPLLKQHRFLTPFVRDLVPGKSELLADHTLFPPATRTTRSGKEVAVGGTDSIVYLFRPIARRLHGLWKGTTVGDCVGGDPRWGIQNATPERWGTIALAGSQLHYIEQLVGPPLRPHRSEFEGFVQAVPLRHKETGDIYGSVEFMSRVIAKRALRADSEGNRQVVSTFDLWLERSAKAKPKDWKGYVIGQSNAFNHDGVLDHIRRKPQFLLGQKFNAKEFQHIDPLSQKIVANSPRRGSSRVYGGNMIFDGGVPDARSLTILREDVRESDSPLQSYETYLGLLNHPDISVSWWASLSLLRAQDPGYLSVTLSLKRFQLAIRSGWERLYGPLVDLLQRKYLEMRQMPPLSATTSELWTETAFELSQWHIRQRLGQDPILSSVNTLSRHERERLATTVKHALVKAVRRGKNMAVRGAAAIALGRLRVKDPSDVKLLCSAARPHFSYRGRIVFGRLQTDAIFALGELGWDHPRVAKTLARLLRQKPADCDETKKLVLDVILKLRLSHPVIERAMALVIEHGQLSVRQKAYEIAAQLKTFTARELERLKYRGDLLDAACPTYQKTEAVKKLVALSEGVDGTEIVFLEGQLEKQTDNDVRESLIQSLVLQGTVNLWTLLAVSRFPLESRNQFLRAVALRKHSRAAITEGIYQALAIESNLPVGELCREIAPEIFNNRGSVSFGRRYSWIRAFGKESFFAFGVTTLLVLITASTLLFFYNSYQKTHKQLLRTEATIGRLTQLDAWISKENFNQARIELPTTLADLIPNMVNTPEHALWAERLTDVMRKIPGSKQTERTPLIAQAKQLIHDLELGKYRKLSAANDAENWTELIYSSICIVANFLGCLFAAIATFAVRRAIQHRTMAERAIRESEERFRLSIASIKDHAIFTLNEQGKIMSWNQSAETITGFATGEIIGCDLSILFSNRDIRKGSLAHELRECRKLGWYHGEKSIARKNGSFFLGQLTLTALGNERGAARGIVAVVRMIEDKKGIQRGAQTDRSVL